MDFSLVSQNQTNGAAFDPVCTHSHPFLWYVSSLVGSERFCDDQRPGQAASVAVAAS